VSWLDLEQEILEDFGSFNALYRAREIEVRSYTLAMRRERTRAWKLAHPERVREINAAYRRRKGVRVGVRGRRGRPFVDQFGNRYQSVRDAAERSGAHPSCIDRVLRGKSASTLGFVFRYSSPE
jgi:hypothetical protein